MKAYCTFFVANKFKEDGGKCRFQVTDPLPISGVWSFAIQKNSKYKRMFNDAYVVPHFCFLLYYTIRKGYTNNNVFKTYTEYNLKAILQILCYTA